MFKVEDKSGSQVLINPLQISYIKEFNEKTVHIVLAGLDPHGGDVFFGSGGTAKAATIEVPTRGRDPRVVMSDWELQLDAWFSERV